MYKVVYVCDKCSKELTIKKSYIEALEAGWIHEYSTGERLDYCSKECLSK